MGCRNTATGHQEIVESFYEQRAIGNLEPVLGSNKLMQYPFAIGIVHIDPAGGASDAVFELPATDDVFPRQDIVTCDPPTFPDAQIRSRYQIAPLTSRHMSSEKSKHFKSLLPGFDLSFSQVLYIQSVQAGNMTDAETQHALDPFMEEYPAAVGQFL